MILLFTCGVLLALLSTIGIVIGVIAFRETRHDLWGKEDTHMMRILVMVHLIGWVLILLTG